jgi:hypothetical protein
MRSLKDESVSRLILFGETRCVGRSFSSSPIITGNGTIKAWITASSSRPLTSAAAKAVSPVVRRLGGILRYYYRKVA